MPKWVWFLLLVAVGVLLQLALWLRKPVVNADELAHRQTLLAQLQQFRT